jgi:1-aminocyclopropane-1-carboxylate deaminase
VDLGDFKDSYVIPEGGTNLLAVKGVSDFAKKIGEQFDYLCCPVGTGGTLAGLIDAFGDSKMILGFSVLKGGQFLADDIRNLVQPNDKSNWQLIHDYHFGGYAKTTSPLNHFVNEFAIAHQVPLEFIYTGKMLAGVFDLISKGFFTRGTTILAIHTGGLQNANGPAQLAV